MANLVSPGYKRSKLINSVLSPAEERIIEFQGLNRRNQKGEGEMADMLNLTLDDYPLMCPRKLRGTYDLPEHVVKPLQVISKHDRIAMIAQDDNDAVNFYYDGSKIATVTGLTSSSRMVAINTKICFFPNKTYLEVMPSGGSYTIGSYGSLEASKTVTSLSVTISSDDARITLAANHGFKYDDAINISGTLTYTSGGTQTASCNISCIIEEIVASNTLVLPRETFIEIMGEGATSITFTGTVSRTMPTLDHIMEWNNRLWGASNTDNTVYACKLGDPTNWQYFQGTSLDSYYAQQGTDGLWSGCAAYSGHIIFFKPDGMCRIYGTAPSNYQVTNTKCYGVEDGSRLSVVTVNDVVYYKSMVGIMAYAGGTPECISEKLGNDFANVVAGSEGQKYYASVQRTGSDGGFNLYVFDINKGIWTREDSFRMRGCCVLNNRLHAIIHDTAELVCADDLFVDPYLVGIDSDEPGAIKIINPQDPDEKYEDLEWMAQFGPFHEYVENKKIYSKLSLRLKVNGRSNVKVYISLDEGAWQLVKEYNLPLTGGQVIPIIPRRCDRYSIKVEGKGNTEIVSLTRRARAGTYGRL